MVREQPRDQLASTRHEKADSAYLDLGVRLVDVAGRAAEPYEKYVLEAGWLEKYPEPGTDVPAPGRHRPG